MRGRRVFRISSIADPRHEAQKGGGSKDACETTPTCIFPNWGACGLSSTFLTLSFFLFFFPGSWLWKKWKNVYSDHTVDVLFREKERFHSYSEKTLVDVWLINHATFMHLRVWVSMAFFLSREEI